MPPGTVLGLAASVLARPRILSAVAIDDVEVSILPAKELGECMRAIPRFAINLTRLLATIAVEYIARSGPLALDPAARRLGRVLASLALPERSGVRVITGLTQEELARMVGTTRTWVSLTLGQFEKRGLIRRQRSRIVVLNAPVLAEG